MVVSRINNTISYHELKRVEKEDVKKERDLFSMKTDGVRCVISIGTLKKDFESENIYFFPIYLIKSNKKAIQIGVFEVVATTHRDADLIENTLTNPLFFSFVNKELLLRVRLPPDNDLVAQHSHDVTEPNAENNEIPSIRRDIFKVNKGLPIASNLKEESEESSQLIETSYNADKNDEWLQKHMKNPNYHVHDNDGKGDCFFYTVQQAFSNIGQETSVSKLRQKVSDSADDDILQQFKGQHDMFHANLLKTTKQIKELSQKYLKIQDKLKEIFDRNEKKALLFQGKEVKELHDKLMKEKKITNEYYKEYKYMNKVKTLDDLKKVITHCDFWAETWTISTMERILNVKFILLSEENYKNDDTENVLLCGHINDGILNHLGVFNPEYYIIVAHTGSHYKLVSYKKKMIYAFSEIPYRIKDMIANKCMEKNAGSFHSIPDFDMFKKKSASTDVDVIESELRGLYDEDVVFQFYSKSSNALPGKGAGEKIPKELSEKHLAMFQILAQEFPDWRKMLSNFWKQPFQLDNHEWLSVEHYYQASKFKRNNPSFYLSFSIDSGTELSKDATMAKSAGGKTGKYKGSRLRPIEVTIDPDFFNKRHKEEMYNAQYAKFQTPNLKRMLLHTGRAKLQHHIRGSPPIVFDELMIIRKKIENT